MDDPSLTRERELFLLAMHNITTTPNFQTDIYSHYQLGGVHGLPFVSARLALDRWQAPSDVMPWHG
jgi:hypothetical protein